MSRFRGLWTTASLILLPLVASAAWAPAKRIDAWFDLLEHSQRVSAALTVSEKGVVRYERVIGFSAIENGKPQPADAGTRYRIGPVSALFTATLVMQLAEGASITLDTPVAEFYPDVPNALTITYRDLMAQRSGLADYAKSPDFQAWRTAPRSHADMLRTVSEGGVDFTPRERFEYSGTNYLLLGYMLEKVLERPYAELVRRQIADKIGLARTYVAGSGRASSLEARGYLPSGQDWTEQPQSDPGVAAGASGLFSNATDLVRFMDVLLSGKLASPHSVESMRGQDGNPGLGLWPREFAGQAGFGHAGSADGFSAAVYHFPARGITIGFTSNASALPMETILDEIASSLFVRGHRTPTTLPLTSAE